MVPPAAGGGKPGFQPSWKPAWKPD